LRSLPFTIVIFHIALSKQDELYSFWELLLVVHPDKEVLFGGPHTIVDITGILTPIKIRTLPITKISSGVILFGS
jgi:hypothetical protein